VCSCVGQALGAESTLPYLDPELNGERLLVGANFASAGIGILNDTGIQFVSHISCVCSSCVENPCSKVSNFSNMH